MSAVLILCANCAHPETDHDRNYDNQSEACTNGIFGPNRCRCDGFVEHEDDPFWAKVDSEWESFKEEFLS